MNYLKEINAFHDEVELNSLTAFASLLWHVLMQFNNKTGWKKEFTVPTAVILAKYGLSESSFLRARKELEEKGYLTFQSGSRFQAPTYQMISQVKEQVMDDGEDTVKDDVTDRVKDEPEDRVEVLFKRKEVKRKERVVGGDAQPHAFYEQNIGMLSPFIAEKITDWCHQLSDELVMESMKMAVQHNKLFFNYCEGILRRWESQQVQSLDDVRRIEEQKTRSKQKKKEKEDRTSVLSRMFENHRKGSLI
ncbi:DnaD domain protein [Halobacillus andaensis]|uniref:DnaD domain protein n=1 Tax=Halobacillus andaensis TaxID=1176239 RepID=UPI003D7562EF